MQLEMIKQEAEGNAPLIGDVESIKVLLNDFRNHDGFSQKIEVRKTNRMLDW